MAFAGRARLALRKAAPLMGGMLVGAQVMDYAMAEAAKPVAPPASTMAASWSVESLPKKRSADPANIKPPLALQDEFDVVVVRVCRPRA
jgi:hypothetical protein